MAFVGEGQKYFEYRVGNIKGSVATLIDLDYNLI